MGIRAPRRPREFRGRTGSAANVLDTEGKGSSPMAILNNGRTGLGAAVEHEGAHCSCGAQAQSRKQFDTPIADFGLVAKNRANDDRLFCAESVVWMVAHYIDSGDEDYSWKRR